MRKRHMLVAAAAVPTLCTCWARGQAVPTAVTVTTATSAAPVVNVGTLFAITISAVVNNPAAADDGIFLFDQNFVESPAVTSVNSTPFTVVSVATVGVDPTFGGGTGTATATGVNGIAGGYDDTGVGIGAPAALYTVTLRANAAGSATFTSGPSIDPFFAGDPGADGFELYDNGSADPAVTYLLGPTVTAVAVPEPAVAFAAAGGAICCLAGRRRMRRRPGTAGRGGATAAA